MRLIDEVCRFIKRKGYYFDVFMSGVLTGLCLCMYITKVKMLKVKQLPDEQQAQCCSIH